MSATGVQKSSKLLRDLVLHRGVNDLNPSNWSASNSPKTRVSVFEKRDLVEFAIGVFRCITAFACGSL